MSEAPLAPTRPRKRTQSTKSSEWTKEEDDLLFQIVALGGLPDWEEATKWFKMKTASQLETRWAKDLDPTLIKGSWTRDEDELIVQMVEKYGVHNWALIAESFPGRVPKQVRERWHNHLNPEVRKTPFSMQEDEIIIREHERIGNKWSSIAKMLPGRTDNSVKNRWYSSLSRRFEPEEKKNEAYNKMMEVALEQESINWGWTNTPREQ